MQRGFVRQNPKQWRRASLALLLVAISLLGVSPSLHAASVDTGLSISPTRQQYSVGTGEHTTGQAIVGNVTDTPLDVSILTDRFSLKSNGQSYGFTPDSSGIVSVDQTHFTLAPHAKRAVNYTINVPADSAKGTYYYAIIASTTVAAKGVNSSIQVASLLYINALGGNVQHSVEVKNLSAPHFTLSNALKYNYSVQNSGNIYESITTYGKIEGVSGMAEGNSETRVLLPGTSLVVDQTLAMPLWPGLYTLRAQATSADTGKTYSQETWVLYIPLWAMIGFAGVIGIIIFWINALIRRIRRKGSVSPPDTL